MRPERTRCPPGRAGNAEAYAGCGGLLIRRVLAGKGRLIREDIEAGAGDDPAGD